MKSSTTQIQESLQGVTFPVQKDELLETARNNGAASTIIADLETLPGRDEFHSFEDVADQLEKESVV